MENTINPLQVILYALLSAALTVVVVRSIGVVYRGSHFAVAYLLLFYTCGFCLWLDVSIISLSLVHPVTDPAGQLMFYNVNYKFVVVVSCYFLFMIQQEWIFSMLYVKSAIASCYNKPAPIISRVFKLQALLLLVFLAVLLLMSLFILFKIPTQKWQGTEAEIQLNFDKTLDVIVNYGQPMLDMYCAFVFLTLLLCGGSISLIYRNVKRLGHNSPEISLNTRIMVYHASLLFTEFVASLFLLNLRFYYQHYVLFCSLLAVNEFLSQLCICLICRNICQSQYLRNRMIEEFENGELRVVVANS